MVIGFSRLYQCREESALIRCVLKMLGFKTKACSTSVKTALGIWVQIFWKIGRVKLNPRFGGKDFHMSTTGQMIDFSNFSQGCVISFHGKTMIETDLFIKSLFQST